jgi:hypothetical protein
LRVPAKLPVSESEERERIPLVNPADTRSTRREKTHINSTPLAAVPAPVHNERQQTNSAATHPIAQEEPEPLLPFP